jgi:hypothetical protein
MDKPQIAGKVASQGAKAANIASAISAGGDFASTAINLISGISDQKKRVQFQNNLSFLTLDQQSKLEKLLIDSNSESERLKILTSALSSVNMQRIGNIASVYAESEKKKRNQQLITIGAIAVVGAIALVIVLKKS